MIKQPNKKKSQRKNTRDAFRCRDTHAHIPKKPIMFDCELGRVLRILLKRGWKDYRRQRD